MNPVKEIDHEPRTIREISVFVRQYIWQDGESSYDVHLTHDTITGEDGYLTDCLTGESFDHMPTDMEIEQLPYIAPTVHQEYPGVYFIYTGPYRKGPYRNRTEAVSDIKKGNW